MCMIIDASRLGTFFAEPMSPDAKPIHRWLNRGRGTVVYSTGGKFSTEIVGDARRKLVDLVRDGKAKLVPAARLAEPLKALAMLPIRSNDPHVLALARASGVRLLYTGDDDLIADFKSTDLINQPRGKVYSRAANAGLLTNDACRDP